MIPEYSLHETFCFWSVGMQMYDQQQNTAVVVINWSCTSLWTKLLWQPASQAVKRAALAYKSALDTSSGGIKGVKNVWSGRWGREASLGEKLLLRTEQETWLCAAIKLSRLQFFNRGTLIFTFSPYKYTSHDAHPVGSATYWQPIQSSPSSACRLCLFWVNEIYSTNAQNK